MLKRLEYLLVVILAYICYVQCQSPEDENCMKQMESMQQRQQQCCPVPDPIISALQEIMQKMAGGGGGGDSGGPKVYCMAYLELFKEMGLLQDDNMVDNDKYKEMYEKLFEKYKKEEWKDLMHESIDKCAESDKSMEMYYQYFKVTKEECNLDSFLMSRCVHYNAEMTCIEAEKKSSPDCTEVDEYMKSCSKFWYNIEAE